MFLNSFLVVTVACAYYDVSKLSDRIKKIENNVGDFLDLGIKATGFIVGVTGIATMFHHQKKTRKQRLDKKTKVTA